MPCPKCRDDGFYYTVPDGVNPFLLGAEGVARVATRAKCNCGVYCQDIGGGRCRYGASNMTKDDEIRTLCVALDKAHALLSVVAGTKQEDGHRLPVGVHGVRGGIARYLTASFVQKCADWCEGEYSPHGAE